MVECSFDKRKVGSSSLPGPMDFHMINFNKILKLRYGNFLISCLPYFINTAFISLNEFYFILIFTKIKLLQKSINNSKDKFQMLEMQMINYS